MAQCYSADVSVRLSTKLQWGNGPLKPMAVVWVDDEDLKQPTPILTLGAEAHRVLVPFSPPVDESTVYVEIYHAEPPEGVDPYVGTAEFTLDDYKMGEHMGKELHVVSPEGDSCGSVEVYVNVMEAPGGGGRAGTGSRSVTGATGEKKKSGSSGLIGGIVKGIGGALSDKNKQGTGTGASGGRSGGGGAGAMVGKAAGGIIKGLMKKKGGSSGGGGGTRGRGGQEGEQREEGEEGEYEEGEEGEEDEEGSEERSDEEEERSDED